MARRRRPSVKLRCVADHYSSNGERIVEFSFPNGLGGLISLKQDDQGRASIQLYRLDQDIMVRVPSDHSNFTEVGA